MSKRQQMEYKQLPFYVQKYDDEQGIVDAIVAVMGALDHQGDIIENNSFLKTITERGHKVKVLDNHSAGSVRDVVGKVNFMREIGRNELPNPLLREYPDATGGLFASIQFLIDTPEGAGIFKRIKASAVDQYSIGYDALDYAYENMEINGEKVNVRRLKTIRLWEISPVVFAAQEATMTVSAKAQPDKENPHLDADYKERIQPSESKPWATFPVGDEYCVFRVDADGDRVGEALGCHDTEAAARQQVEALYAAEPEAGGKGDDEPEEDKGVSGRTDWPLADRGRAWDNAAAEKRVRSWAGAEEGPNAKYRSCHFWHDAGNADNFTAYKLLFCDVVGGQVKAVPRGLFAVAAVLQGARGGAAIPAADQAKIKSRVAGYYARMRREFDDDSIVPSWEKSNPLAMLLDAIVDQSRTEEMFAQALRHLAEFDCDGAYREYARRTGKSELTEADKKQAVMDAVLGRQDGPLASLGTTIFRHVDTGELKFVWQDDGGKHHEITESEIRDMKEGRVLSAANANRIKTAVTSLLEALGSAGIDIMEERGKAGPPPGDAPTSEEAGPRNEAVPTGEMLKLIEAERERISIAMEV